MNRGEHFYPFTVLMFAAGYLSYLLSKVIFVLCATPLVIVLLPFPRAKAGLLQAVTRGYLGFFTRRWLPWLGLYRIVEISGLERVLGEARFSRSGGRPSPGAATSAELQILGESNACPQTCVAAPGDGRPPDRPVVFVANHRGFMDSILLLGLLPRTGVLIKVRDARQPAYALLTRHFDLVSVDRNSLSAIGESLERSRALLAEGKNLLVFPEGARARSGRLQHFNRIAFQLALASGVPVVPVIVHSTVPFMARVPGSIFPRGRNEFRIRFLDPEIPQPDDDAERLCDRVHSRMALELKTLDAGTPWEVERPQPVGSATTD